MKTRTICLAVVTGLLAVLPLRTAEAGTAFSFGVSISNVSDFYEPLGAYGSWVEVASYGRCWRPAYIGGDWQPYADGHWEWTDQGWYWVSDEPWAWATYHYGRWVFDPYYGWVWVPGVEWAPAWVAWREGGGYCGWAPLPPTYYCGLDGVVLWERVGWYSRAFVFVEFGRFCEPVHYRHHYQHGWHHPVLYQTVHITSGPHHGGPRVADVERRVGHSLPPVRTADLRSARAERPAPRTSVNQTVAPSVVSRGNTPASSRHDTMIRPSEPSARRAPDVVQGTPTQPRHNTVTRPTEPSPRRAPEAVQGTPSQPRYGTANRPPEPSVRRAPEVTRSAPSAPSVTSRENRSSGTATRRESPPPQRQEYRPAPQTSERSSISRGFDSRGSSGQPSDDGRGRNAFGRR